MSILRRVFGGGDSNGGTGSGPPLTFSGSLLPMPPGSNGPSQSGQSTGSRYPSANSAQSHPGGRPSFVMRILAWKAFFALWAPTERLCTALCRAVQFAAARGSFCALGVRPSMTTMLMLPLAMSDGAAGRV